MKIDVDKVKSVLLDKTVPASLLEKTIGVNRGNISKLRNGKRNFENLTIETAMKVQKRGKSNGIKYKTRKSIAILHD